jgi:hypothetical protein
MDRYTVQPPARRRKRQALAEAFRWWAAWAVPGLGMFSEGESALQAGAGRAGA